MTKAFIPRLPRQVKDMFRDYVDSWSNNSGEEQTRDRRRAALYFYLPPSVLAIFFLVHPASLITVTPFLTALSVFTGLLFGLLIMVFNTAITLRKDGAAIRSAHGLDVVIADLRATVTYSIVVAGFLVILLSIASATGIPDPHLPSSAPRVAWGWTPAFVWLAVHLILNVGKILERIRTAFRYISQ